MNISIKSLAFQMGVLIVVMVVAFFQKSYWWMLAAGIVLLVLALRRPVNRRVKIFSLASSIAIFVIFIALMYTTFIARPSGGVWFRWVEGSPEPRKALRVALPHGDISLFVSPVVREALTRPLHRFAVGPVDKK